MNVVKPDFCKPFRVLSRDIILHIVDMADLSAGQLRAAEDVLGEGTLTASFS